MACNVCIDIQFYVKLFMYCKYVSILFKMLFLTFYFIVFYIKKQIRACLVCFRGRALKNIQEKNCVFGSVFEKKLKFLIFFKNNIKRSGGKEKCR